MTKPPDPQAFARLYITTLKNILDALPYENVVATLTHFANVRQSGKTVFLIGNGGSAATASHMANDLMKTITKKGGKPIKAIALTDTIPLLTAIGNDVSYDNIFADQLSVLAAEGDTLIVVSGSGNSPNILRAVEIAKDKRMKTIGFLGMDGGTLRTMVDIPVIVPSHDYGPIEDVHLIFNHLVSAYLSGR